MAIYFLPEINQKHSKKESIKSVNIYRVRHSLGGDDNLLSVKILEPVRNLPNATKVYMANRFQPTLYLTFRNKLSAI